MAKPCSVFTAAIGGSASAMPVTNSESKQMANIRRKSVSEDTSMTHPWYEGQTRASSGRLRRPHIAQYEKAAIESIQISATVGAMIGNAPSKNQPTFEQFSRANIFGSPSS
jgi:hypothetical protein